MNIKFQSSVIFTKDFGKMKDFYQNIMKQEIEFDFGNCIGFKCGLSIWSLQPEYTITKNLGYSFNDNGNKNLELCFETDDFENIIADFEKIEIKYLHNVIEEKWGQRTIRFFDPEDNLLEIGETIFCFVKRFYNMGMTYEEIANRTSVPIEHIEKLLNS